MNTSKALAPRVTVGLVLLAAALVVSSQIPLVHPVAAVVWVLALLALIAAFVLAVRYRKRRAD